MILSCEGSTGEAPGKFVAIVDVPIKAASEAAAAGEAVLEQQQQKPGLTVAPICLSTDH